MSRLQRQSQCHDCHLDKRPCLHPGDCKEAGACMGRNPACASYEHVLGERECEHPCECREAGTCERASAGEAAICASLGKVLGGTTQKLEPKFEPIVLRVLGASGSDEFVRTPGDLARFLDEEVLKTRARRATDVAWTTPFAVSRQALVESIVVGHLRAWGEPPRGSWCDGVICTWAEYVATCFSDRLEDDARNGKNPTLLELMPRVMAWLRDFPSYRKIASRFFDIEAAEQNISSYLRERAALFALLSCGDKDLFDALTTPTRRGSTP